MSRGLRKSAMALAVLGVAAAVAMAAQDSRPFTPPELAQRAEALFRYGAVEVPHGLLPKDAPEAPLFARVAAGEVLDVADSTRYRRAFQDVLLSRQWLFRLLDDDLCLATDHAPDRPNNVGGAGIAGRHDLHAASAGANAEALAAALDRMDQTGPLGRIAAAQEAYKDLTDLMVHLAPAVHSVVLDEPPPALVSDPVLSQAFAGFYTAMTEAAFAPVGGPAYTAAIARAQTAYAGLAAHVQTRVTARLNPLEQRIAGRWLAVQQVQPQLTLPADP